MADSRAFRLSLDKKGSKCISTIEDCLGKELRCIDWQHVCKP